MSNLRLTIVHITDTHIGGDAKYVLNNTKPYDISKRVIDAILKIPFRIDAVIHTGDVCGDKDVHSTAAHYELASELLRAIPCPAYFLAGNHDRADLMFAGLAMPEVRWAEDESIKYCYSFSLHGETFIALDTVLYEKTQGHAPEALFAWLEKELSEAPASVTVLMHGPPVELHSPWMDRNMLIDNGEKLHQLLARHNAKLSSVLFGHIHQPFSLRRDGVPYHCAAAAFGQFTIGPDDEIIQVDAGQPPGFSILRYSARDVLLQRRTV